ncbi:MAG: hypothetical protein Q9227_000435 [Pyrenula ochraceoflavens]
MGMKRSSQEPPMFVLNVQIPGSTAFPKDTQHAIYVQRHEPTITDSSSERSLFLSNVPIVTTEAMLKHLFHEQLAGGRVDYIEFPNIVQHNSRTSENRSASAPKNRKRKRMTIGDAEASLQSALMPNTWDRRVLRTGAHAIIVFVDQPSMEAAYMAVQRASKLKTTAKWGKGLQEDARPLGMARYLDHFQRRYPPKAELLKSVNAFMTKYTQLEELRSREEARKRQEPDEEGFVMVTKGSRGGVIRSEEAVELGKNQKQRETGLENFYRFQTKDKRKAQQAELLRQFEKDRKTVEDMRKRHGNLRPRPNPKMTLLTGQKSPTGIETTRIQRTPIRPQITPAIEERHWGDGQPPWGGHSHHPSGPPTCKPTAFPTGGFGGDRHGDGENHKRHFNPMSMWGTLNLPPCTSGQFPWPTGDMGRTTTGMPANPTV